MEVVGNGCCLERKTATGPLAHDQSAERRNALDRDTVYALKAALAESARDDTRLVVLTGAGGAFSSGADLLAAPLTSDNSRGRTNRGRL